jgi:DNA-binding NarL/FixJ family response regulator
VPAAAAPHPIRILIADDHELFAEGLADIVGTYPDLEVVGRARDGSEAVALTEALHPDLVLMDVEMPRLDGIAATREIATAGRARVLMVSAATEPEVVERARAAGATGYVFKGCALAEMIAAIREAVASPSSLVTHAAEAPLATPRRGRGGFAAAALSTRAAVPLT